MIENNFKAILFASLIVAMILPFSSMNMADATPNNVNKLIEQKDRTQELKDQIISEEDLIQKMESDLFKRLDLESKIKDAKMRVLSHSESIKLQKNERMLETLHSEFDDLQQKANQDNLSKKQLNKMMKIQDRFESRLIESDIINFVTTVGIDLGTKEIQIGLNQNLVNDSNIGNIVFQLDNMMPKKAKWHFILSNTISTISCTQELCDPLIGGNEIRIDNGQSDESNWKICSFGYKAKKDNNYGIVTAGHCLDGLLNKEVHDTAGKPIGYTVSESFYWGTSCDCGWILTGNSNVDNKVYLTSNSQPTISSTTSTFNQQNDWIIKSGRTTGVSIGKISAINVSGFAPLEGYYVKDMVRSNAHMLGGDSGGVVVGYYSTGSIYGVVSGFDMWGKYHEPVDNLNSILGTTPVLG